MPFSVGNFIKLLIIIYQDQIRLCHMMYSTMDQFKTFIQLANSEMFKKVKFISFLQLFRRFSII